MIYPKCKDTNPNKMGNAMACRTDGTIIPCCFFGSQRAFDQLVELLGEDIKNINLKSGKTIAEINKSDEYKRIEDTWTSEHPLKVCVVACSNPDHILDDEIGPSGTKQNRRDFK